MFFVNEKHGFTKKTQTKTFIERQKLRINVAILKYTIFVTVYIFMCMLYAMHLWIKMYYVPFCGFLNGHFLFHKVHYRLIFWAVTLLFVIAEAK